MSCLAHSFQLPQILAGNADFHMVLEIIDRTPRRNSHFTAIMQRIFDSYILALPHLAACRSLKRRQRTLLTIESPIHKDCWRAHCELESEISWFDSTGLRLSTTACQPPRFRKEIIMKHIGLQGCPRGLFPIPEED